MMPARYISATTSMMPEPQMPVMPVVATASANARVVGPHVDADHLEARFERERVDPDALDRAGRGALAAADLRALERRPGGAGRGELAVRVAEHDLGVGADVDEQLHALAAVRTLGEDRRGGVGADVAGDARADVHAPVGQREVEVGRGGGDAAVRGERERRLAERRGVDAEHDVMHDRVADEHHLEHAVARGAPTRSASSPISSSSAARTASVSCRSPPGFIITYDTRLMRSSP